MTDSSLVIKNSTNVRTFSPWSVRTIFAALRLGERVSPALTARAGLHLFTRPRSFSRPEREHEVLALAERIAVPVAGGHLPAWRWGTGPAVLLVHGWEGRGAQLGSFVQPMLNAGLSVVAFDAPAHGDAPGQTANLFTFAQAIHATAAAVGPLHGVVAHSMGGAASLYALRGGLSAKKVVFVSPANAGVALDRFRSFVGLSVDTSDRMHALLEARFGAPLSQLAGPLLASSLDVPALVIHDDDDAFVPWGDGAAIAEAWSGSALHTTTGLGHHRILRDPEVIARTVAFLA